MSYELTQTESYFSQALKNPGVIIGLWNVGCQIYTFFFLLVFQVAAPLAYAAPVAKVVSPVAYAAAPQYHHHYAAPAVQNIETLFNTKC